MKVKKEIFAKTKTLVRESLTDLRKTGSSYFGADTETEGLSAHSDRLWSIQIADGNREVGVLIPVNLFHNSKGRPEQWLIDELNPFFSDEEFTFIFHNAKFDVQFLKTNGIEVGNVFCTAVTEKILTAGKLGFNNDLKSTLKRRFKIELSKDDRKDFYDGTFKEAHEKSPLSAWSDNLIEYALGDVYDLVRLMIDQLKDIRQWNLKDTLALEMDVLHVVSKEEFIGIGIDAEECKIFQQDMAKRANETLTDVLKELNPVWEKIWRKEYQKDIAKWDSWALKKQQVVKETNKRVNGKLSEEAVQRRAEMDKLKPFKTKPKEKGELKLRSADPMKKTLFSYAGLALPDTKKETLEQFRQEYPILEEILEYKKYAKLAEFGELYDKINTVTGRIHASVNQIVATGRQSYSDPNLQQIPSRTEEGIRLRALFQSRKGYKFIGADFAGIELVILGVLGEDQVLLDAVNSGRDVHCFTMSKILNAPYEDIYAAKEKQPFDTKAIADARKRFEKVFDLPAISDKDWTEKGLIEWIKGLRDYTKTLSYGVAYQLSKYGLARKFHCSVENAELFIEAFFDVYKGVGKYVNSIGQIGYDRGYSETKLGRKRFFRYPRRKKTEEIIKDLKAKLTKEGRNVYEIRRNPYEWNELVEEAIKVHRKEINAQINAIKREAGNMPIQGMSADITKLSMVLFDSYLIEMGCFKEYDEGLILTVHDELIAEVTDANALLGAELLKRAMVTAAHHFLGDDVLIIVEPWIDLFWKKN